MSTEKLILVLAGQNFGIRHVDKYIEMSMSLVFLPEPNPQSCFHSKSTFLEMLKTPANLFIILALGAPPITNSAAAG
jgi:hypothetical protein